MEAVQINKPVLVSELEPSLSSPQPGHYTDWANAL
jgi:hypothetical protein